jgi:hypothetical protein
MQGLVDQRSSISTFAARGKAARTTVLRQLLQKRLAPAALAFAVHAEAEVGERVNAARLSQLIAVASRHARRQTALAPTTEELSLARAAEMDVNIAHWSELDALRALLVLSHPQAESDGYVDILEHCFRFADESEMCALYRSLPLLPNEGRFTPRACEGCRSNMPSLFEAVACDSQLPAMHFDDVAWLQMIMKAIFINAPLWRIQELDERLSPELTRMALDYADERRSAKRPIPPQLWLCLGTFGGERALHALRDELRGKDLRSRRAALLALARADQLDKAHHWLGAWLGELEPTLAQARAGDHSQQTFRLL